MLYIYMKCAVMIQCYLCQNNGPPSLIVLFGLFVSFQKPSLYLKHLLPTKQPVTDQPILHFFNEMATANSQLSHHPHKRL